MDLRQFWSGRTRRANATAEMVAAGQKFLGILHKDQRGQATIAFTDEERMNWHYIPRA